MVTKAELEAVKEHINKEPKLFIMSGWHYNKSCGTAHCIGGWLETLYPKKFKLSVETLRISRNNFPCSINAEFGDKGADLFHADEWHNFISDELIDKIDEAINEYSSDEYLCNDSFDELPSILKKDFACRVIDEYIAYYNIK